MPPKSLELRGNDGDTVLNGCPECHDTGELGHDNCACNEQDPPGRGLAWVQCTDKKHDEDPSECVCKGLNEVISACPNCRDTPGFIVAYCSCSRGRELNPQT